MKWGDGFLFLACLLISLLAYQMQKQLVGRGSLRITVVDRPSLSRTYTKDIPSGTLDISGKLGTSTLEMTPDGSVRFVFSPCPNQVCVHAGWVRAPFAAVCVPNGIMIDFPQEKRGLDGVTY